MQALRFPVIVLVSLTLAAVSLLGASAVAIGAADPIADFLKQLQKETRRPAKIYHLNVAMDIVPSSEPPAGALLGP